MGTALGMLVAACAALALLVGAPAGAQTFTDPNRSAADQYGTPTPTPTPTATATPTPGPGGGQGGAGGGGGDDGGSDRRDDEDAGVGAGGGGGGGDQAARREAGAGRGSLPFTGFNTATIVLLGLLLASGGFALRAIQRRRPAGG